MARVDKGNDLSGGVIMQPDRTIVEKNDGTLEGTVTFKCDQSMKPGGTENAPNPGLPQLTDEHPDDKRLECYNITRTYSSNGILILNCSYFGLTAKETTPVVQFSSGANSDPIETHPQFDTLTDSGNYSYDDQGNFLGFTGGDLRGVQYYLTPSSTVTVSVWRDSKPTIGKRIARKNQPSGTTGYVFPTDIKDWLLIDVSYRQVGSFYQLSEVWQASGPDGWNTKIYP